MEGIEVPSYFLCPISLQIMKDPVTLPTGITYDRDSIETWIFTNKHNTCPFTNQPLLPSSSDYDQLLTPNHTLHRLIQAWCVINGSQGIERFPTPRPPITKSHILHLLHDANPNSVLTTIKKLKSIISESERNKRCVESAGAIHFLASVIRKCYKDKEVIVDEALSVLYSLQLSDKSLDELLEKNVDFVHTLTYVLQYSSGFQARAYATMLLKSIIQRVQLHMVKEELIVEMVKIVEDRISNQAVKAALQVLNVVVSYGRNRVKAVEGGAVGVVIELMVEETERRMSEMALVVLSRLSECAEGREKIVEHGAGIAIVSKKLVRVSMLASERAVMIMYNLGKYKATKKVLKEMLEFGVVGKLCLLVQVDCGGKSKERVKELLALHSRVWRNSPCISLHLQASYPGHDL